MTMAFLLIQIIILLMSVIIHEVSHGTVAYMLGDPTAKYAKRLSLNPIRHLDLWGSFLVPLFLLIVRSPVLFGWAKPVPYNPYNLKYQKWGPALVAGAGPGANLFIALVFGLLLRFIPWAHSTFSYALIQVFSLIVILNILLAVFNLVPIPPLDGSKILFTLIPSRFSHVQLFLERYGFFILLFFIFFLFQYIFPLVFLIFKLIVGQPFLIF